MRRPKEGWENPYGRAAWIFEEGADAMLDALKQSGIRVGVGGSHPDVPEAKPDSLIYPNPYKAGWLVFIPDEEVK